MKMKQLPTQKRLRELIHYDGDSGTFAWKKRYGKPSNGRWNGRFAGKPAGTISEKNRIIIVVDYIPYHANRLAWVYIYGDVLSEDTQIDHKNCDTLDNKLGNLRAASHGQNCSNSRGWRRKRLPKGASKQSRSSRYRCRIGTDKGVVYLGTFDTPEEASYFYGYAAQYYNGEYARAA